VNRARKTSFLNYFNIGHFIVPNLFRKKIFCLMVACFSTLTKLSLIIYILHMFLAIHMGLSNDTSLG
jgi:hypothetical protein